jgi:DnaJ-class molecular chaperone
LSYDPLEGINVNVCGSNYKVLGLDHGSPITKERIKKAFRQKSLLVHPDNNLSLKAGVAFQIVQDAYDCLLDEDKRRQYDLQNGLMMPIEENHILEHHNDKKVFIGFTLSFFLGLLWTFPNYFLLFF